MVAPLHGTEAYAGQFVRHSIVAILNTRSMTLLGLRNYMMAIDEMLVTCPQDAAIDYVQIDIKIGLKSSDQKWARKETDAS